MVDAAQRKTPDRAKAWTGRVQQLVAEWRAKAEPMLASDAVPMRPERICREITAGAAGERRAWSPTPGTPACGPGR